MDSINTSKHNKIKFQMYFKSTESMITIDFTPEINAQIMINENLFTRLNNIQLYKAMKYLELKLIIIMIKVPLY